MPFLSSLFDIYHITFPYFTFKASIKYDKRLLIRGPLIIWLVSRLSSEHSFYRFRLTLHPISIGDADDTLA